jgi:uncharacterized protein
MPTYDQCINMLYDMSVPDNVIKHSIVVQKVALFLTRALSNCGVFLDENLAQSAALLHDITKVSRIDSGERHDISGAALLEKLGYPEIAYIIAQHISLSSFELFGPISEAEIVFYSDKRVMHEQIVSIDERYRHSIEKYMNANNGLANVESRIHMIKQLENKIFCIISIDPLDIARKICFS